MQQTPNGWPSPSDVETVPEFQMVASTDWLPESITPVSQVSIRRDLTGGGLPGAARAGAGFSVADGSVTVPQPSGERVTPWAAAGARAMPGGGATIQATHGAASLPLGSFIVDTVSGADSSGELAVDLIEDQRRMDTPFTYQWAYDSVEPTMDASAVLAACAEAAGYSTSWTPDLSGMTSTPYLVARMDGCAAAIDASSGWGELTAETSVSWTSRAGQVFLAPGARVRYHADYADDGSWLVTTWATTGPYVRVVVDGAGCTITGMVGTTATAVYRITPTVVTFTLGAEKTSVPVPSWGAPVALEVRVRPSRVEVRNAATGELASAARPTSVAAAKFDGVLVQTPPGGYMRDIVIAGRDSRFTTATPPTARIEATGSPITGVFDVAGSSARDVFQDIAKATMGAGWQDETGALVYRSAESLRTGRPVETVVADGQLEDIPWEISRENVADRIEVSYTPASVVTDTQGKITLWEATELSQILAGRTITLYADITGTTDTIAPFLPIWDTTTAGSDGTRYSRWAAASQPDGGGTRPADDALLISTEIVSPSRVKITITNTTTGRLWLVDGNGSPCLILRTTTQVQPGEQETISWGQPPESAETPFEFDCGQWVQDATTAQRMLDWLSSQMRAPMATIPTVNVKPDLARQLGDVVLLTEEPQGDDMPLLAKALVTGMDLSGDANGYDTTLTLALLGVTFSDVDSWGVENGVTTFQQFDTWCTNNGITTFADLDAYAAAGGFY